MFCGIFVQRYRIGCGTKNPVVKDKSKIHQKAKELDKDFRIVELF
jgi:hypothetical protein